MYRGLKKIKYIFVLACAAALTTACSGFFDKDNTPAPAALTQYKPEVTPRLIWSTRVGSGTGKHDYLKMSPTLLNNTIYTSSTGGLVTAVNKETGRVIWQTNLRSSLSTGPGVNEDIVVVANHQGDIYALAQQTGQIRWQNNLTNNMMAKPAIGNGSVVVKGVNGTVTSLSSSTGTIEWALQQTEPNLLLRGASSPLIKDHYALVGFANGNLAKVNINNGDLLWLQTVAIPEGAFAIQRMIDIDANPILFQNHVYAATYQGSIASLDWASGKIRWSQQISSYTGMTTDGELVYITDTAGHLYAFGAETGQMKWRQDLLLNRRLSGPTLLGQYIVVGDGEGYLHFINKSDGHLAGRASLGAAIHASPLTDNQTIYALTSQGYLAAYRL